MKKLRWQLLIVLLSLVAVGLLLVGQQPAVVQQVLQPEPTTGGVYGEALIGAFGRLNPVLDFYNSADRDIDRLLFRGLVQFDDRGLAQGDLAESWGISQDGKVYNFSIRPNAVWHDGLPVTADDMAFTVDYLRSEDLPIPADIREFWKQIEIVVLDEKTLQFRLPEPFAPFLDYLTFGVLPKHLLDGLPPVELINADFNLEPVGSGPYRFERILSSQGEIIGVELSAFEDYYAGKPFIEQFIFRYYPDAQSALEGYRQGNVQGISRVGVEILPEVLREPDLQLHTGRLPQLTLIYFNLKDPQLPFLQDADMRRALLMGLNRQWMVDRILDSQTLIADGPIFPGTWAYYEGIEHLDYDPEKALEIIKAAGYTIPASGGNTRVKDDISLAFELVYPADSPTYTALAESVRRDWGRLGVQISLKPVVYAELVDDYLEPRTYQAALVDLNLARSPDPDPYPFWDQAQITGGQNYAGWDDRQASEYLERARVTVDIAERTKAYRNFQVRFTQEMPALPLFYPVYSYAVDVQVQGVGMGPLFDPSDRFLTVSSWYLITSRTEGITPTPTP